MCPYQDIFQRKISNESASIVIGKISDNSEDEDDKGDQGSSLNESLNYFRLIETKNEEDIVERNIPGEVIEGKQFFECHYFLFILIL